MTGDCHEREREGAYQRRGRWGRSRRRVTGRKERKGEGRKARSGLFGLNGDYFKKIQNLSSLTLLSRRAGRVRSANFGCARRACVYLRHALRWYRLRSGSRITRPAKIMVGCGGPAAAAPSQSGAGGVSRVEFRTKTQGPARRPAGGAGSTLQPPSQFELERGLSVVLIQAVLNRRYGFCTHTGARCDQFS